jgi:acetyl-CoA carboxylase biotin carboxyl carrier protein
MLNVKDIQELIKTVDESSIDTFKFEYQGMKMMMDKSAERIIHSGPVPSALAPEVETAAAISPAEQEDIPAAPAPKQQEMDLHNVLSPMVGTFYSRPNPEAAPFAEVGTKVQKGQVVCMLEAMKLFNEIEAEAGGEVVDVLVKDGELIEYGQPLLVIKKN